MMSLGRCGVAAAFAFVLCAGFGAIAETQSLDRRAHVSESEASRVLSRGSSASVGHIAVTAIFTALAAGLLGYCAQTVAARRGRHSASDRRHPPDHS